MANFNPVPNFLVWQFNNMFLHSPQHKNAKFANLVKQEQFTGANQYQDIIPQVDGIDYDPESSSLRQGNTPMMDFVTKRVGYRKRGHTWGHPIATEDFHRTQAGYQGVLAGMAAQSFARWKDRVLLSNADGFRYVLNNLSSINSPVSEQLPADNRYAVMGTTALESLDIEALQYANLFFKNNYADESSGDMPLCVASPSQIQGLLNDEKITNSDYNTVRALVRGEVNSYLGFSFQHNKAGQTISSADDVYFKANDKTVKIAATSGYAQLTGTTKAERIVFCLPKQAFSIGPLTRADYTNVWQNPLRMGTLEFTKKSVIGYKRCQNEFVLVAYAKEAANQGTAIRQAPVKSDQYWANYDTDGGNWAYSATQA